MRTRLSTLTALVLGLCWLLGMAGGAGAQTTFVPTQSFAGTPGADLSTLTNWVRDTAAYTTPTVLTLTLNGSQGVRSNGSGLFSLYYYNVAAPSADYTIPFTFKIPSALPPTGTSVIGVAGRVSGNNGYICTLYYTSGAYYVLTFKLLNGTTTQMTNAITLTGVTAGSSHSGTFRLQGPTLTETVDGQTATNTDGEITAAGFVGIYDYGSVGTDAGEVSVTGVSATTIPAVAPTMVAVNDSHIVYSPGNWVRNGSAYVYAANFGAYNKIAFNGTSFAETLDTTALNSTGITVQYSIDGGALQSYTATSSTTMPITLATGLAAGTHTRQEWLVTGDLAADRWNAPADCLKLLSFTVDNASSFSAYPAVLPGVAYFYTDSIADGPLNWCDAIGDMLQCETGHLGFSASALASSALGSPNTHVPALFTPGNAAASSWDKIDAAHSRLTGGLFTQTPTWIINETGRNDGAYGNSDAAIIASTTGWWGAVSAAAPGSYRAQTIPFSGAVKSDILGGFSAWAGGYTTRTVLGATVYTAINDSKAFVIDVSGQTATGMNTGVPGGPSGSAATFYAVDGVHPATVFQIARLAALLGGPIEALSSPVTASKRRIQ